MQIARDFIISDAGAFALGFAVVMAGIAIWFAWKKP